MLTLMLLLMFLIGVLVVLAVLVVLIVSTILIIPVIVIVVGVNARHVRVEVGCCHCGRAGGAREDVCREGAIGPVYGGGIGGLVYVLESGIGRCDVGREGGRVGEERNISE